MRIEKRRLLHIKDDLYDRLLLEVGHLQHQEEVQQHILIFGKHKPARNTILETHPCSGNKQHGFRNIVAIPRNSEQELSLHEGMCALGVSHAMRQRVLARSHSVLKLRNSFLQMPVAAHCYVVTKLPVKHSSGKPGHCIHANRRGRHVHARRRADIPRIQGQRFAVELHGNDFVGLESEETAEEAEEEEVGGDFVIFG